MTTDDRSDTKETIAILWFILAVLLSESEHPHWAAMPGFLACWNLIHCILIAMSEIAERRKQRLEQQKDDTAFGC